MSNQKQLDGNLPSDIYNDDECDMLPSISNRTYSTFERPRRGSDSNIKKIPEKYWNSRVRFVEYPEGVLVDNCGQLVIDTLEDEGDVSDDEFEKLHPAKRRKILKHLKKQQILEEQEEKENLEYDKLAKTEGYDISSLVVDKDFASYMKGDEEYIPSDVEGSLEESETDDYESCGEEISDVLDDSDCNDSQTESDNEDFDEEDNEPEVLDLK